MSEDAQPVKILVVDDDPVNLMLTCQTLTGEGFDTIEADSGEAALKAFRECLYDLVVLDVIMPGIDGFETCRQLRALPGGSQVPIMIMTGLDDEQSISRAFDVGATDFITKPITWPLLGHRVRYILRASQSMQVLAQSRAGLANAQRIAKMGSWDFDLLRNEMKWSEEVFRILEINVGEVAPSYQVFLGSVHPDDRKEVDRIYQNAIRNSEPCEIERRLLMPDARVKWVSLRGRADDSNDPQNPRFMVTIQDITDRKQAEEALRGSEARYALLAEHMTEAVWLIDTSLKIKYLSPSLERMRGYSLEEIERLPIDKHLTPQSLELALEIFSDEQAKVVADPTYTPARTLELEFIRKDGTTYWSECTFTLIRDKNGNPESILGESRDITARRQAEEEKKVLQERLQHADKMEAIGTLAGGIAHDFNNLLMGIQGYATMTLMNLNQDDPNYERIKRIEQQVQSGADLNKQLLGFARGGRYEVKPTDMNDVIEKSSSMFGRTKKEIIIDKKYEKDLCTAEVDRGQMEQVFLNLYVNAWQAMPGGGQIYLETQNVLLENEQRLPYSVKPGKYVKITITDTGTGMDEKTRERIFDPFFTTKKMGRGTGLGLATVYGIIKGHGGMINVYSEPGHGTTFSIYLPASEKEVVKEETATGTIDRGTETILLVDDEKMILEVSKELLESIGYRVFAAGSGQEALAVYMEKRTKIDLVILDMIMPGISGGETFDRLREINPGIKVLLSSGYSLNGEAKHIMDRGCNGFLQKPFHLEQLASKIREMLG